ncbi:MAG: PfaD family polyunsaturated fatty acid/polyketide biosynthesis protein [Gammaproteobacteria bacterium]
MNPVTRIAIENGSPEKTGPTTLVASGLGWWTGTEAPLPMDNLPGALRDISKPIYILMKDGAYFISREGSVDPGRERSADGRFAIVAYVPVIDSMCLGEPSFCNDYRIRFPYMTGSMANGIASTALVKAVANAGMLGSFGAAGLSVEVVERAINTLRNGLGDKPFCFNLIHSPNEPGREEQIVDLYIKYGIKLVEASAYLALTLPVVRYRVYGIHRDGSGNIVAPNRIIAKASRIEVATRWFSPPPVKMLQQLLDSGEISQEQCELARHIPMAQDLTVEADSGGHTDNRPAITLLPTMSALRDRLQNEFDYSDPLRIGAAGGIATPASAAAAFAMGAAYIVTGTINQACIESGSSDIARKMLAEAEQADTAMAPAVDMFEMGVKLQVLKRGTLFPMRGNKLYEYYRLYNSIDEIPEAERENLEKTIFRAPLTEIWQNTRAFFQENGPAQIIKAEQDPRHKMALIFRWYLGLSSRWANSGKEVRQADYQIWCGPAMGAFNEWVKGSFLENPENRKVVTVALNLLFGAVVTTRINMLRNQGVPLSSEMMRIDPIDVTEIENRLN